MAKALQKLEIFLQQAAMAEGQAQIMSDEISKTHSVIADNLAAIHDKIYRAEAGL